MSDDKILAPEEYYERAYKRNISIAELWLKEYPKPKYLPELTYTMDFDPWALYKWSHETKDGGDLFIRESDGAIAKFTKYSHINFKK